MQRGKPIQGCSDGVVSELLSIYILIEKKDLAIEPLPEVQAIEPLLEEGKMSREDGEER